MKAYYSANEYFLELFGEKTYKLALDANMTCPNRANGSGGCIFCSEGGSGDFAQKPDCSLTVQLEKAIERVKGKNPKKFIAYFQSYTNTYAPLPDLEKIFYPTINHPLVSALSIATRPDCLDGEVISLLSSLNKIKPVFVELGLQTSNDKTARLINRGYETEIYYMAVSKLKNAGINVITHVILGLPGETEQDIFDTLDCVIKAKSDGIKLQLLHVLKNTKLEKMYENGKYVPLEKEQYITLLAKCIRRLPPDMVVHRITGDAPKKLLVAPLWSADKKRVLNDINAYFEKHDIRQGQD